MIKKPTLILDENKCKKNLRLMFEKSVRNQIDFRPHFKTHQSREIGLWFRDLGIDKITVSSIAMAEYFSKDWKDITIAFPVNVLEIEEINSLAENIKLNLLIESNETIDFLKTNLTQKVNFFIKIDVGYHRTGIQPEKTALIDEILDDFKTSDLLEFKGFLSHAGHTYKCRSNAEVLKIHDESLKLLSTLKNNYLKRYPNLVISYGDTPSCSIAEDFSGCDEIRPGNFVFYDLAQEQISSCDFDQIAVAMACPIVATHPQRNEIVIYGGGVHFSKEGLVNKKFGTIYGLVVEKKGDSWGNIVPDMYIKNLSQEHGIVSVPKTESSKYKIGDYLLILPVHSCMTNNLMRNFNKMIII
jgi:D-serine deaminase-like pyridoxal phosphate-dependent protein